MKRIICLIAALGMILTACEEWDPVLASRYKAAPAEEPVRMEATQTIAGLKALYRHGPSVISGETVIKGQVITEDRSGNFYKSLYIQDATGAIELKLGRNGLYNDYKLGQWLYVDCEGLTLGQYNGMLQLGFASTDPKYETSYIEERSLIAAHIFKGPLDRPVEPVLLDEAGIAAPENFGRYVTVKGLTYGNEVFCIVYVRPDDDSNANRVFISADRYGPRTNYGLETWAMSKDGFLKYLAAGNFDTLKNGDRSKTVAELKADLAANAEAVTVSQYFKKGRTDLQVRTSGYARFADTAIDRRILDGARVTMTGILTYYVSKSGKISHQFSLIDLNGVSVEE